VKVKAILAALCIFLVASLPTWAKYNPPLRLLLQNNITMNGVEVPAGSYDLTWEDRTSTVQVSLWKDGKFFAMAHGAWVKNAAKYAEDMALVRVNSDGTRSLIEIRVAGMKRAIVLNHTEYTVRVAASQP
jgi:hypothetical protein